MELKTIKHTDVRGKELMYIKIGDTLINVGQKTFDAVNKELDKVEVGDTFNGKTIEEEAKEMESVKKNTGTLKGETESKKSK